MKPIKFFLFFTLLLFCLSSTAQLLQISPAHPERGDEVTICYFPSRAGATIPDTVGSIHIKFTYSNLYSLPYILPMQKLVDHWEVKCKIPFYGTYATFYLESGSFRQQPGPDQHFALTIYKDGKRIENSRLYEGYSLSAQVSSRKGLSEKQAALYREELNYYPDNYEAKIRLLQYNISQSKGKQSARYRKKAEALIAKQFKKAPGIMGNVNKATMGYLIIGENSRVDSLYDVVRKDYPHTPAGKDLIVGDILREKDTLTKINALEKLLESANDDQAKENADIHRSLFYLYAGQKQVDKMLYHFHKAGYDESPYGPSTLVKEASTLLNYHLLPDTAIALLKQAMALSDQFPVGLIRYFPETGYVLPYVSTEDRKSSTIKATANIAALFATAYWQKQDRRSADSWASKALSTSEDSKTLDEVGNYYRISQQMGKAYDCYRKLARIEPENSEALDLMKDCLQQWHQSGITWNEAFQSLKAEWKEDMLQKLKKEIILRPAPNFLTSVVDLQGNPVDSSLIKNKIVIIDFWATWCVPCMHEMPYIQKAWEAFRDNRQVVFMVINSGAKNKLADAQGWWGNKKYGFPVYYNKDEDIGEKFGFNVIPALYIFDGNGNIRFSTIGFEGASTERKIITAVEMLLNNNNTQ